MIVTLTVANKIGWYSLFLKVVAVVGWPNYWSETDHPGWSKPPSGYGIHWRCLDAEEAQMVESEILTVRGVKRGNVVVAPEEDE